MSTTFLDFVLLEEIFETFISKDAWIRTFFFNYNSITENLLIATVCKILSPVGSPGQWSCSPFFKIATAKGSENNPLPSIRVVL